MGAHFGAPEKRILNEEQLIVSVVVTCKYKVERLVIIKYENKNLNKNSKKHYERPLQITDERRIGKRVRRLRAGAQVLSDASLECAISECDAHLIGQVFAQCVLQVELRSKETR